MAGDVTVKIKAIDEASAEIKKLRANLAGLSSTVSGLRRVANFLVGFEMLRKIGQWAKEAGQWIDKMATARGFTQAHGAIGKLKEAWGGFSKGLSDVVIGSGAATRVIDSLTTILGTLGTAMSDAKGKAVSFAQVAGTAITYALQGITNVMLGLLMAGNGIALVIEKLKGYIAADVTEEEIKKKEQKIRDLQAEDKNPGGPPGLQARRKARIKEDIERTRDEIAAMRQASADYQKQVKVSADGYEKSLNDLIALQDKINNTLSQLRSGDFKTETATGTSLAAPKTKAGGKESPTDLLERVSASMEEAAESARERLLPELARITEEAEKISAFMGEDKGGVADAMKAVQMEAMLIRETGIFGSEEAERVKALAAAVRDAAGAMREYAAAVSTKTAFDAPEAMKAMAANTEETSEGLNKIKQAAANGDKAIGKIGAGLEAAKERSAEFGTRMKEFGTDTIGPVVGVFDDMFQSIAGGAKFSAEAFAAAMMKAVGQVAVAKGTMWILDGIAEENYKKVGVGAGMVALGSSLNAAAAALSASAERGTRPANESGASFSAATADSNRRQRETQTSVVNVYFGGPRLADDNAVAREIERVMDVGSRTGVIRRTARFGLGRA